MAMIWCPVCGGKSVWHEAQGKAGLILAGALECPERMGRRVRGCAEPGMRKVYPGGLGPELMVAGPKVVLVLRRFTQEANLCPCHTHSTLSLLKIYPFMVYLNSNIKTMQVLEKNLGISSDLVWRQTRRPACLLTQTHYRKGVNERNTSHVGECH